MPLARIIKSCLENTSIKGIPRIVKSKRWIVRCVWVIGVTALAVLGGVTVWGMVSAYLGFPHVIILHEHSIYEARQDGDVMYPDVTVCNLNSHAHAPIPGTQSKKEYIQKLKTIMSNTKVFNSSVEWNSTLTSAWNKLLSPSAYFAYLGKDVAYLASQNNAFLIDCAILRGTSLRKHHQPCREDDILNFTGPDMSVCFTLTNLDQLFDKSVSEIPFAGVTFTLYLGHPTEKAKTFDSYDDEEEAAGVKVIFNTPHNPPDLQGSFVDLKPGHHAHVLQKIHVRKRIGPPHGRCVKPDSFGTAIWSIHGKRVEYTATECANLCTQVSIQKKCGCLDPELMVVPTEEDTVNTSFCGQAGPDDIERTITEVICSTDATIKAQSTCSCPISCHEQTVDSVLSSSTWPVKSQHPDFYKRYISGTQFASRFAVYEDVINLTAAGNHSDAIAMLHSTKLIEDNFVKVTVMLREKFVSISEDTPQISLTSLMCSVGGALNLYSGVTFVVCLEMLELIYLLLIAPCSRKEKSGVKSQKDGSETQL